MEQAVAIVIACLSSYRALFIMKSRSQDVAIYRSNQDTQPLQYNKYGEGIMLAQQSRSTSDMAIYRNSQDTQPLQYNKYGEAIMLAEQSKSTSDMAIYRNNQDTQPLQYNKYGEAIMPAEQSRAHLVCISTRSSIPHSHPKVPVGP
ncbi:hypothetical protein MMC15_008285 [Xylographa vitiligo]|nr:hypothetical protein [Xylographa vitiligo]